MVFALGFRMQVYTQVTMRDADFKTKSRPATWTLKPDPILQFR